MAQDELADSGPFGDAADLGDIGMQRDHPLQGGIGEAVPLEVAEVGNLVDEDVGPLGRAIRSSFTVVSPENTTEPSAVSKRYPTAGIARPCVTATAVTRTTPSSKTATGTSGRERLPARPTRRAACQPDHRCGRHAGG